MNWVLVVYIYAGMFAKGDSVTLHSVPGFKDEASCKKAGASLEPLVKGTAKDLRFVCVAQP